MDASRVDAFRSRLDAYARARLQPEDLRPRLRIDAELDLHEIDDRLVGGLAQLGPFGAGNPRPVFHARSVEVARGPRTIKERHIRMSLRQDGRVLQAMAWRAADAAPFFEANRAALDVAFSVEESEFRGERYVELHLADARLPTGVPVVVP